MVVRKKLILKSSIKPLKLGRRFFVVRKWVPRRNKFFYRQRNRRRGRIRPIKRKLPLYFRTRSWGKLFKMISKRVAKSSLLAKRKKKFKRLIDSDRYFYVSRGVYRAYKVVISEKILAKQTKPRRLFGRFKKKLKVKKSLKQVVINGITKSWSSELNKYGTEVRRLCLGIFKHFYILRGYGPTVTPPFSNVNLFISRLSSLALVSKFRTSNWLINKFFLYAIHKKIKSAVRGFVPYLFRDKRKIWSKMLVKRVIPLAFWQHKYSLLNWFFKISPELIQIVRSKNLRFRRRLKAKANFRLAFYKKNWTNKWINFYTQSGNNSKVRSFLKLASANLKYFRFVKNVLISNKLFVLTFRSKLGFKLKRLWSRGTLQEYASFFKKVKSSSKPYIWAIRLLNTFVLEYANRGSGNDKLIDKLIDGTQMLVNNKSRVVRKWVYAHGGDQITWADTFKRFIRFSKKKRRRRFKTFR